MQKMGWFGAVRGHSWSWAMPPFDRAHTNSYSTLIETMRLCSVPWHCWLGGRKGIRPVKNWAGAGVVICLERGADLHTAQLMPLPLTVSCFGKIQIGFAFLVPAHLGRPGQRAIKRVYVSIFYCIWDIAGYLSKVADFDPFYLNLAPS